MPRQSAVPPKPHNGEKEHICRSAVLRRLPRKLRHHTNTINKDIHYFVCANNKVDYRGECPGRHYVRADAIEQVVMLELHRMAEFLESNEEAFAELLAQKTDKELLKKRSTMKRSFKGNRPKRYRVKSIRETL